MTNKYGLEIGNPDIASVGALTFGPNGILFVADNRSGAIFAIDMGENDEVHSTRPVDVENLGSRLASFLGCDKSDLHVKDLAVHPISQSVVLSVIRGRGDATIPVLLKVAPDGAIAEVKLTGVAYSRAILHDAPAEDDERVDRLIVGENEEGEIREIGDVTLRLAARKLRTSTITDMAFIDGTLLVAGTSNEEFSSTLRRIAFPFNGEVEANSLEIYHVSHGQYETASPIRTFLPFDGNTSVLASYTCTPVVKFSLTDLEGGTVAKGKTVAELGSMNQPFDMVSYLRDGEEYILVSNTRHPLLKIPARSIDAQEELTAPKEPIGVPRETLAHKGVTWMANLNGSHVLMMHNDDGGELHLHSYATATL